MRPSTGNSASTPQSQVNGDGILIFFPSRVRETENLQDCWSDVEDRKISNFKGELAGETKMKNQLDARMRNSFWMNLKIELNNYMGSLKFCIVPFIQTVFRI